MIWFTRFPTEKNFLRLFIRTEVKPNLPLDRSIINFVQIIIYFYRIGINIMGHRRKSIVGREKFYFRM